MQTQYGLGDEKEFAAFQPKPRIADQASRLCSLYPRGRPWLIERSASGAPERTQPGFDRKSHRRMAGVNGAARILAGRAFMRNGCWPSSLTH
ncbi:hypothetical protein PSP6_80128 [Paraburkholderia tropica]|nr:hypothetical protein PSP6_80128 [Paraburkholderia tropica]